MIVKKPSFFKKFGFLCLTDPNSGSVLNALPTTREKTRMMDLPNLRSEKCFNFLVFRRIFL